MIKTTGLEFKRFYKDPEVWPKDAFHDDLEIYINAELDGGDTDLTMVSDSAKVKIESGVIIYSDDLDIDFCAAFRRWRKKQSTATLVIECPRELVDVITAGIKSHGGKVA